VTNNVSVSLDLQEGLVFGELRAFVDVAARLGARHSTAVELLELENHDVGVVGLKVIADDDALVRAATAPPQRVTIDRRTVSDLLDAITTICDEDGDARKVLADIQELRSALEEALVTQ
jgi:hypothetical protein